MTLHSWILLIVSRTLLLVLPGREPIKQWRCWRWRPEAPDSQWPSGSLCCPLWSSSWSRCSSWETGEKVEESDEWFRDWRKSKGKWWINQAILDRNPWGYDGLHMVNPIVYDMFLNKGWASQLYTAYRGWKMNEERYHQIKRDRGNERDKERGKEGQEEKEK